MSVQVLVLAAHDHSLLDELAGIIHRAVNAADHHFDVITNLQESPEEQLHQAQFLLRRDAASFADLCAFVDGRRRRASRQRSGSGHSLQLPLGASNVNNDSDTVALQKKIHKRDKKIKALSAEIERLTSAVEAATTRANVLESEQEQFFRDVQHMKEAYDKLHDSHQMLLWEYLPSRDPDMRAIPRLSKHLEESAEAIGRYPLGEALGYGQYAVVYASDVGEPLAIKAIDKDKLVDLVALHRVSCEIASLRDPELRHPGILGLRDVLHTRKHIYLVTERGGKDLFEFFGAHDDGVPETVIRPLVHRIALAVQTLHRHHYCHRDLKPENILYSPEAAPAHIVKLVDFGLCTKTPGPQDPMLHDFCGSPGFFAPEILLNERYDGMKADVWSLGCILLELIVGNALFATMWMGMYEFETLKDRRRFGDLVRATLEATRGFCHSPRWSYSPALRQLLLGLLCERPHERLTIHEMLEHQWFQGLDAGLAISAVALGPTEAMATAGSHSCSSSDSGSSNGSGGHQSNTPVTSSALHLPRSPPGSPTAPRTHLPTPRSPPHPKQTLAYSASFTEGLGHTGVSGSSPRGSSHHPHQPQQPQPQPSLRPLSADGTEHGHAPHHHHSHPSHHHPLQPLAHLPPREPVGLEPLAAVATKLSPTKIALPSLSPEKPPGARSPDKSFAKRNATLPVGADDGNSNSSSSNGDDRSCSAGTGTGTGSGTTAALSSSWSSPLAPGRDDGHHACDGGPAPPESIVI